jgi:hypothetical protein
VATLERRFIEIKEARQSVGWFPGDLYYFQPDAKIDKSKLPIFHLKLLTMDFMALKNNADNYRAINGKKNDNDFTFTILHHFVECWENYRDACGRPVMFDISALHALRQNMKMLLYNKIFEISDLAANEYEGLQILAGVHAGALSRYKCAKCRRTPGLCDRNGMIPIKENNALIGCKPGDGKMIVQENKADDNNPDTIIYFHCPLKFIPKSILRWYNIFSYYRSYPNSAPKYTEQTQRYISALQVYNAELSNYRS